MIPPSIRALGWRIAFAWLQHATGAARWLLEDRRQTMDCHRVSWTAEQIEQRSQIEWSRG